MIYLGVDWCQLHGLDIFSYQEKSCKFKKYLNSSGETERVVSEEMYQKRPIVFENLYCQNLKLASTFLDCYPEPFQKKDLDEMYSCIESLVGGGLEISKSLLSRSGVSSFEVCANIKHKDVPRVFQILNYVYYPRMKKIINENGVTFYNKSRSLVFYNKKIEGERYLRIDLRFKHSSSIRSYFKSRLKFKSLLNVEFQKSCFVKELAKLRVEKGYENLFQENS